MIPNDREILLILKWAMLLIETVRIVQEWWRGE